LGEWTGRARQKPGNVAIGLVHANSLLVVVQSVHALMANMSTPWFRKNPYNMVVARTTYPKVEHAPREPVPVKDLTDIRFVHTVRTGNLSMRSCRETFILIAPTYPEEENASTECVSVSDSTGFRFARIARIANSITLYFQRISIPTTRTYRKLVTVSRAVACVNDSTDIQSVRIAVIKSITMRPCRVISMLEKFCCDMRDAGGLVQSAGKESPLRFEEELIRAGLQALHQGPQG
jgi:hypothetical protein